MASLQESLKGLLVECFAFLCQPPPKISINVHFLPQVIYSCDNTQKASVVNNNFQWLKYFVQSVQSEERIVMGREGCQTKEINVVAIILASELYR